jgi:chromosome segregation ATPase
MDLSKLTQGLAFLKSGLDDLDSQCTQHAAQCMQLRQQVLQEQRHRRGLEQQAGAATAELHERQEQVEDLSEVLQAVKGQAAAAQSHKEQLQVRASIRQAVEVC